MGMGTGTGIVGVRVVDMWPHVPMVDDSNVLELYADAVGELKLHGANFTTTYFVWGRNGPHGSVHRVPVIKIVRPCDGLFGMRTRLSDVIRQEPSIVPG